MPESLFHSVFDFLTFEYLIDPSCSFGSSCWPRPLIVFYFSNHSPLYSDVISKSSEPLLTLDDSFSVVYLSCIKWHMPSDAMYLNSKSPHVCNVFSDI